MSKTKKDIQTILDRISYKPDWKFRLEERDGGFLFQIRFVGKDTETGKDELQSCRKWYISSHSTTTEVVRTAYKAVLAAEEHEASELFRLDGEAVYSPHADLAEVARSMREKLVGLDSRPT